MGETAAAVGTLPAWVRRRTDPGARFGLRVTLFALAISLLALPFGFLVQQVASHGSLVRIDASAARALHPHVLGHPHVITALKTISFFGGPIWFYVLIPAVAVFWLVRRRVRLAVYVVVTTLLGGLVDTVAKLSVHRGRPAFADPIASAHGKSFPSGHVMTTTYAYGAVLLTMLPLIPRRWRGVAIGAYFSMIVVVACARLGLGVHYLSDVIGGFILGIAWLTAATAAFSIWRLEEGKKPVELEEGIEPEAR
jgi:undecaprenyl-diphosphatase